MDYTNVIYFCKIFLEVIMNFNQFINKQNIIMTEDEHNVYDFLKHHDPNWSSNYIDHLLDGRDKVSQRLITSLHRRI